MQVPRHGDACVQTLYLVTASLPTAMTSSEAKETTEEVTPSPEKTQADGTEEYQSCSSDL